MKISDLKEKKITVMGLGLHGGAVAAVSFLCDLGATVTVTDLKSEEQLGSSIEKLKKYKNIKFILNQHRPEDFAHADLVIKNPGVSRDNKYIKVAEENKVPVEMDASLFFKLCPNKIIGVTGTKGKTTTSTLIYEILKTAGKDVIKVGIGQVSVLDKLKKLKKDTIVVFELSSWRLSALAQSKISPAVAVITNIYQDHLNYYKTMSEYIADKKFIFQNQKKDDVCVINVDNDYIRQFEPEINSKKIKFSLHELNEPGAVYVKDGTIYFNDGVDEKRIMEKKDIVVKGDHNLENILAAIAVAVSQEIDINVIKKAITHFSGVSQHRLELVGEIDGVKYYNDTAATTPESAIRGLNSFSEPVVLICGGSDKNLDMKEFAKEISSKTKSAIFFKGVGTDKIIEAIKYNSGNAEQEFTIVDSMAKAVELASAQAQAGDVVLLSPGAASFGLFQNEFDRGDQFREAVKELK
jgi:UDP-N-acetylmuramoylalanine--D-glutamate ligase